MVNPATLVDPCQWLACSCDVYWWLTVNDDLHWFTLIMIYTDDYWCILIVNIVRTDYDLRWFTYSNNIYYSSINEEESGVASQSEPQRQSQRWKNKLSNSVSEWKLLAQWQVWIQSGTSQSPALFCRNFLLVRVRGAALFPVFVLSSGHHSLCC